MQKPNDRFILSTTPEDSKLIRAVLLRSGKGTIAEKTFGCSCDAQSSSCDDYKCDCNTECRCDSECRHCRCNDYCQCEKHCACDSECSCDKNICSSDSPTCWYDDPCSCNNAGSPSINCRHCQ